MKDHGGRCHKIGGNVNARCRQSHLLMPLVRHSMGVLGKGRVKLGT